MTGTELKRRREALRLTQQSLAERMEVHMRTISAWERGINPIPGWVDLVFYGLELHDRLTTTPAASRLEKE